MRKVGLRALSANRELRKENFEVGVANKFDLETMSEQLEEVGSKGGRRRYIIYIYIYIHKYKYIYICVCLHVLQRFSSGAFVGNTAALDHCKAEES